MSKKTFKPHHEVNLYDYKGVVVRFRIIDDSVYIPISDIMNILQCRYLSYSDILSSMNTAVKIIFYKNDKTLWAIEPQDLPVLCRMGGRGVISKSNQDKIDWMVSTAKQLLIENSHTDENGIQIFQNPEFGQIRIVTSPNNKEPLFCLADICAVLELTPSKVAQRLGDDVLSKYPIIDSLGRTQQANFVNEDGLYDTILDSRKSEAKQFRKWVTGEVLPSIRKHGAYMTNETLEKALTSPDYLIQLANQIKDERVQKELAIEERDIALLQLKKRNIDVLRMQPKEEYYNVAVENRSTYTTWSIASELGITYPTLRKKLYLGGIITGLKGKMEVQPQYCDWTQSDLQTDQGVTKWTKYGRDNIFDLINPEMPK